MSNSGPVAGLVEANRGAWTLLSNSLARQVGMRYLSIYTFMRRICSLSIILFFLVASLGAQQTHSKQSEHPAVAQQATPPSADYSQEAFVIEHYLESFRFENDGTGREQIDARIKVNGESGVQALGQLKVGYSALSDKLEVVYVRVIKPDGTVITAQESAIQDLTIPDAPVYTDYHQKHITVPSLRPGDVLEYQFVRTIVNPLTPGQFWTSYDFKDRGIVLDEQLEINVPKARQIKLKSEPGRGTQRSPTKATVAFTAGNTLISKTKTKLPKRRNDRCSRATRTKSLQYN